MRNLEIGRILGNAVEMYRKHWEVLLSLSASIHVVAAFALAALIQIFKQNLVLGMAMGAITAVVVGCANIVLQGMYVLAVDDLRDGRQDVGFGELWERSAPMLIPLFITSAIAAIGTFLGFICLFVPGLILMTFWYLSGSVVVLEKKPYFAALGRSWELVRGHGMPVFGLMLVTWCITTAASFAIASVVGHFVTGEFAKALVKQLPAVVTGPFAAMVPVLAYFDLRGDTRTGEVVAATT